MKACEIELKLNDVLGKVSKGLAEKIKYSIDLLKKSEKMALRLDGENGFFLAFSGGKDSQCLYHVAKLAGVKYKAHMNLTSIDPPQVIRFVREHYPDIELGKPEMSIYDMAVKKHLLPTIFKRWCCAEYKEKYGVGKVTLVGIRHEESPRRRNREEVSGAVGKTKLSESFDQFSEHEETMVSCVGGKDKIIVSPILEWTKEDVWEFLNINGIPHCELYDNGYERIGCLLCPMSSTKQKAREIYEFPHVKQNWIKAINALMQLGYYCRRTQDPEQLFRWWISKKSWDKFYADEIKQQKISFKN